jgi:hypothetical protein
MERYHEKVSSKVPAQAQRPPKPRNAALESLWNLNEKYGLGKNMQISRSAADADAGQVSIAQEYHTYVADQLSSIDMDVLRYWEVCRTRTSNI